MRIIRWVIALYLALVAAVVAAVVGVWALVFAPVAIVAHILMSPPAPRRKETEPKPSRAGEKLGLTSGSALGGGD